MTTTTSAPAPRRDRFQTLQLVLFTAGAILMPAGLIAVGLGWYGAAHAKYAYDQFPYLLSGGLSGVCLTTLGGFLYFGSWQAKTASDQKQAMKQIADSMTLMSELIARVGQQAAAPGSFGDPGAVPVVAGDNGAAVHRRDCILIAHRDDLRELAGSETGLTTCRVCSPVLA